MMVKVVVVMGLLAIIYCLGSGAYYLVRADQGSASMVKALTWRIGLSFLLFAFLFFSYWMGWLHPHAPIQPLQ